MLVLGGATELIDADDKLNWERRVKDNEHNESGTARARVTAGFCASVSVDTVSYGGIATSWSHAADRGEQRVRLEREHETEQRHERENPPPQLEREREGEKRKHVTCTGTGVDHFGHVAVNKAFCIAASAIEQGDLLRAGMLTYAHVC